MRVAHNFMRVAHNFHEGPTYKHLQITNYHYLKQRMENRDERFIYKWIYHCTSHRDTRKGDHQNWEHRIEINMEQVWGTEGSNWTTSYLKYHTTERRYRDNKIGKSIASIL